MNKENNKKLIEEFPFLLPRNVFHDTVAADYDYDWTLFDEIPTGWGNCFGLLLCQDIKEELVKFNILDDYRVLQIKEKFGSLRWYDNGHPKGSKLQEILSKYEFLSEQTCIVCGKLHVPMIDDGWVSPYCKPCYKKIRRFGKEEEPNWNKLICEENDFMTKFTIQQYSSSGKEIIEYDISDIIERIDDRYKVNLKKQP